MRTDGIPLAMVQMIRSFLDGRRFQVRINNSVSDRQDLKAGVPQGSVLSPLLYSIFTHDIPKTDRTTLAIYADDTAILTRSKQPYMATRYLQESVERIENWCRRWLINVNPDKSRALLLARRRVSPDGFVRMFNADIPWSDQVKYLGGKMATAMLRSLVCRRSALSIDNKLLLYKSVIRPTMTYASVAWSFACDRKCLLTQIFGI
ncbi:putative RNA-directed DNA polymerase from transposon X-element-like Protein [Tribolium castaneum]|uniref:Putative RNA-directed DNA polymerase from transposon X-element-like Protein n=1 Tax=Tribolium castaneum TaxID=7070 RepID=A0A139W9F6_TRICA|nr:putative RNA-directed DNA polymerase from transposon X-element-like Protein [Tribolium castaneum]